MSKSEEGKSHDSSIVSRFLVGRSKSSAYRRRDLGLGGVGVTICTCTEVPDCTEVFSGVYLSGGNEWRSYTSRNKRDRSTTRHLSSGLSLYYSLSVLVF